MGGNSDPFRQNIFLGHTNAVASISRDFCGFDLSKIEHKCFSLPHHLNFLFTPISFVISDA